MARRICGSRRLPRLLSRPRLLAPTKEWSLKDRYDAKEPDRSQKTSETPPLRRHRNGRVCLSATAAPRRVLDGRRRPRDTRGMGPSSIKATDALSQDAFALYSPSVGCRSVRGDSPLERPRILRELTTTSESSSSSESVLKAILSTSCSVRDMANAKMSCQRERWRWEVVVKRRNDSQSHSRPSHPHVARALPSFNAALTTELATFSENAPCLLNETLSVQRTQLSAWSARVRGRLQLSTHRIHRDRPAEPVPFGETLQQL